jgi:hypothetical protein
LSGGDDDSVSVEVLLLSRKRLPTFLPPASSEMLAAENVTLDVEKHDRQRLNASIPPKTKGHQIGAQALERSAAQGGAPLQTSQLLGV